MSVFLTNNKEEYHNSLGHNKREGRAVDIFQSPNRKWVQMAVVMMLRLSLWVVI